MADIVNLNQFCKNQRRAAKKLAGAANRLQFGRTKPERKGADTARAAREKELNGKKISAEANDCQTQSHILLWPPENSQRDNFPRVHKVQWVDRLFDTAHHIESIVVLRRELADLAVTDTMFSCACPVHLERTGDQPVI